MTQSYFGDVVGQEPAKRALSFFLQNYEKSRLMPHLIFIAQKGNGKTFLASALAHHLKQINPEKRFFIVNCATVKGLRQFFDGVLLPCTLDKECTILLDEASELPKDVTMGLLTMLNPNSNNRNTFSYDNYTIEIDFRRHTFLAATTEAHRIFHALLDRLHRIDLDDYTYDELGEIVRRGTPELQYETGLLDGDYLIPSVLRGNARQAQKMADHIKTYAESENTKTVTIADWNKIKYHLGIHPLGLSPLEIKILRILQRRRNCSLTYLSACTGLSRACLQRDFELYLSKMNLMTIGPEGRNITGRGLEYLKFLDNI